MGSVLLLLLVSVPLYAEREPLHGKTLPIAPQPRTVLKTAPPEQPAAESADSQKLSRARLEIAAAMLELRVRYPDFASYEARIAGLAESFLPGRDVTARAYLEGLYFIAKHSAAREMHSRGDSSPPPPATRSSDR